MKTSRYSEEQIIGFLKQADGGMPIKELCRKGGFSDANSGTNASTSIGSRRCRRPGTR